MNYLLEFVQEAENDLHKSIAWYDAQKSGLGKIFYKNVKSVLSTVKINPFHFPVIFNESRHALVKNFPFKIHFLINEEQKKIIVLGIFHTSRNPEVWEGRVD